MPYIHTSVSCPLTRDAEVRLKSAFGEAITCLVGKTEDYLMLRFTDRARLWLGGSDKLAAMLEVSVYGALRHEEAAALTERLTNAVSETLLVPPDRIYVKYVATPEWGFNGTQF